MPLQTLKPSIHGVRESLLSVKQRAFLLPKQWRSIPAEKNRCDLRITVARGGNKVDGFGGKYGEVLRRNGVGMKDVDMATLGNLCVDIVLDVPSLPPALKDERLAYMERLEASPPDKKHWEAGGNCNLAIAAARLGLHCASLGHVGDEIYGHFLLDVLREEGIDFVDMNENIESICRESISYQTLLCWVLVDPFQKHGFCSRADFSDEPMFNWMRELSAKAKIAIQLSKILFCNGYAFDEFSSDIIISALYCAIDMGTAVFFDPGPRARTLLLGLPQQQRALELFLRHSDVLLFTADEAESLTGITNPIQAGQELLKKGAHTRWVIIKMGGKGSILITNSSIICAPAFKVNVVDTVGCGDSFTAAIGYGFLHDISPVSTLVLANAVGAATATGCGAGRNVADLDKVSKLLSQSNLNEDDNFWRDLINENLENPDILLVSKVETINGQQKDGVIRLPIQHALYEILPKLNTVCDRKVTQV
ncbi:probable fructokinase-1 [Dioscorea cayenensis subsp. rotundata]|uniref:Probable fructokinase-1 n=1 Tax=Dioscorea cayennensis subsp. rotundata TaxID=55577 RepID=A0AB40AKH2_DIOCR|nr:probable fructokinase-1 [Dioscorea cayenensis subsp. rotundata]